MKRPTDSVSTEKGDDMPAMKTLHNVKVESPPEVQKRVADAVRKAMQRPSEAFHTCPWGSPGFFPNCNGCVLDMQASRPKGQQRSGHPRARLDADRTAKPKTEIAAVFADNGQVLGFNHQIREYVVRPTKEVTHGAAGESPDLAEGRKARVAGSSPAEQRYEGGAVGDGTGPAGISSESRDAYSGGSPGSSPCTPEAQVGGWEPTNLASAWAAMLGRIATEIPNHLKSDRFYEAINDMARFVDQYEREHEQRQRPTQAVAKDVEQNQQAAMPEPSDDPDDRRGLLGSRSVTPGHATSGVDPTQVAGSTPAAGSGPRERGESSGGVGLHPCTTNPGPEEAAAGVCNRCFCACDCCVDRVRGKLVPCTDYPRSGLSLEVCTNGVLGPWLSVIDMNADGWVRVPDEGTCLNRWINTKVDRVHLRKAQRSETPVVQPTMNTKERG